MSGNIDEKIGRATAWSSITEIVAKLITPIVNMVLARLLLPEAFGIVATITMIISFAELFTDAGFQKYIVQHEFEDEDSLNKSTNVAFWTNLAFSMVICIVIFLFRHPLAELVGAPELGNSISIASFLIIIAAFSSIQMARYKRDFDFKTLFYIRIVTSLIPLVVTIPLAIILKNYWALLAGTFVTHISNAVILTAKSKWKPQFFYSIKLLKEMLSFTIWTLLESVSIWLTGYIDIFVIGNKWDSYYLGLYKTSISTVNSFLAVITAAITPVLFSALSRYQNDDVKFKETFYTFQRLVSMFVLPMGVGVFVYRELVTKILLGSSWLEATEFIGYWGLTSCVVIVFSYFSSEVYRSKGNPKLSLLAQLIHLVFLVPTLFIASQYGFETLCLSRSLIRLQDVFFSIAIMCIIYKFKPHIMIKNVLSSALSALIMGAAGWFMLWYFESIYLEIASVFVCIVLYFVVLLMFPKTRKELFSLPIVKKIIKKKQ